MQVNVVRIIQPQNFNSMASHPSCSKETLGLPEALKNNRTNLCDYHTNVNKVQHLEKIIK